MCTRKYYGEEGARGLFMLRVLVGKLRWVLVGKLQRSFCRSGAARESDDGSDFDDELEVPTPVPDDVKEGHFAVLAVKGAERKRFVVKMECLSSPAFLRLLEQAEEEYGFEQTGAIAVPCRPEELQKVLKS